MGSRDSFLVKGVTPAPVIIAGNFAIDGSSAVSTQSPGTSVFTPSKPAGTGIYQVQLTEKWKNIFHLDVTIVKAAGTLDMKVDGVQYDATNGIVKFQIKKSSDGTALDPTSITVSFAIFASNSGVTF